MDNRDKRRLVDNVYPIQVKSICFMSLIMLNTIVYYLDGAIIHSVMV